MSLEGGSSDFIARIVELQNELDDIVGSGDESGAIMLVQERVLPLINEDLVPSYQSSLFLFDFLILAVKSAYKGNTSILWETLLPIFEKPDFEKHRAAVATSLSTYVIDNDFCSYTMELMRLFSSIFERYASKLISSLLFVGLSDWNEFLKVFIAIPDTFANATEGVEALPEVLRQDSFYYLLIEGINRIDADTFEKLGSKIKDILMKMIRRGYAVEIAKFAIRTVISKRTQKTGNEVGINTERLVEIYDTSPRIYAKDICLQTLDMLKRYDCGSHLQYDRLFDDMTDIFAELCARSRVWAKIFTDRIVTVAGTNDSVFYAKFCVEVLRKQEEKASKVLSRSISNTGEGELSLIEALRCAVRIWSRENSIERNSFAYHRCKTTGLFYAKVAEEFAAAVHPEHSLDFKIPVEHEKLFVPFNATERGDGDFNGRVVLSDILKGVDTTKKREHVISEKKQLVVEVGGFKTIGMEKEDGGNVDVEEVRNDEDISPEPGLHEEPFRIFYLRDCYKVILDADDPEKLDIALDSAPKLIETRPEDLPATLRLENQFSIEDFHERQVRILALLAARTPSEVTRYLADQFSGDNYHIKQRSVVLDSLASAARILSKTKRSSFSGGETRDRRLQATSGLAIPGSAGRGRLIQTHRSVETIEVSIPFLEKQALFFYSLFETYRRRDFRQRVLSREPSLLGRLIHTLSVFIVSSGDVCLDSKSLEICSDYFEFLFSLRSLSNIYLRNSVCAGFLVVLQKLNGKQIHEISQGRIRQVMEYAEQLLEDDDTRDIALSTITIIATKSETQVLRLERRIYH